MERIKRLDALKDYLKEYGKSESNFEAICKKFTSEIDIIDALRQV